jgi:hypothetical protein
MRNTAHERFSVRRIGKVIGAEVKHGGKENERERREWIWQRAKFSKL